MQKKLKRQSTSLILLLIFLLIIVTVIFVLVYRVKLYNQYEASLTGTEVFQYEVREYHNEPRNSMLTIDQQLFFTVDKGYYLLDNSDYGTSYQFQDEQKYITINFIKYDADNPVIGGMTGIKGSEVLSEQTIHAILKDRQIYNSTDLLLHAIEYFEKEKVTFFSPKKKLEESIFFNSLIQDLVLLGNVEKIAGNIQGLSYSEDNSFLIANGNKSYYISFIGNHSAEEIDRFLNNIVIKN